VTTEIVPADIAAAISDLVHEARALEALGSKRRPDFIRACNALDAAILTHLRNADEMKAALQRIEAGT
jgi:hypothetical protein